MRTNTKHTNTKHTHKDRHSNMLLFFSECATPQMVAAARHVGTQTAVTSITQGYGDEKLNLKQRTDALGHQPAIKQPRNDVKKHYVDVDKLRKTAEQRLEVEMKRKIGSDNDNDDDFAPMLKSTKRSMNLSMETIDATDALMALMA